jgi:Acylamino-acid-releasing enzyme, N-terminal domain
VRWREACASCELVCCVAMQEDWGELNTGKRTPALFVLDLKRWHIKRVEHLPEDISAGQPVWTPDGMTADVCFAQASKCEHV